ncbi:trichothecene 3-o-acetyltransferase [Colletotrichum plurivorum]|uniref:Trichothecene 3-o-acetyltransferase n=1 Tax=Colletotrichum plurivorum TaxID=2175906 RepID=A0A8H6JPJ6_9PEZI|nr:trichothecene 3-o-acetyltransferase [Colletotrichum plurivorum]
MERLEKAEEHVVESVPLAIWNQGARRQFMSICLCFPLQDNAKEEEIVASLRASLDRLAAQRPDFAGTVRVELRLGVISLETSKGGTIPLTKLDASAKINISYNDLKRKEFPPSYFLHSTFKPAFDSESGRRSHARASLVNYSFIQGGLLLWVHLNHAFADGLSQQAFVECLAAQTRGEVVDHPASQKLGPELAMSEENGRTEPFTRLMESCQDLTVMFDDSGPGTTVSLGRALSLDNSSKSEKIFVFKREKLQELRGLLANANNNEKVPTIYQCLAALTWANVCKARAGETAGWQDGVRKDEIAKNMEDPYSQSEAESEMMISVNWRKRVFQDDTKDYFGNTTTYPMIKTRVTQVLSAAESIESLAALVGLIDDGIKSVDKGFVARHTKAMAACQDIRILRAAIDLMNPACLGFNTWRYFGADEEWELPGLACRKADAVRRVSSGIGVGTALILPAKKESEEYELVVSLMTDSINELCRSEQWMRWVDHVIE